jgi:hypothetical protein
MHPKIEANFQKIKKVPTCKRRVGFIIHPLIHPWMGISARNCTLLLYITQITHMVV